MKLKNNILSVILISLLVLFLSSTFVSATTYDLSDYKNCQLQGNGWCIVYSVENDNFYLITLERTDYPYLCTICSKDEEGNYYISGEWASFKTLGNYNAQGGVYCYTFNKDTNKFENRTSYGIGKLNLGVCEVVASGCDLYVTHNWSSFFQQTPLPSKVVFPQEMTLMEVVEENLGTQLMEKTLGTQLTTLIKVGLIIFGLLLAPFLIKYRT